MSLLSYNRLKLLVEQGVISPVDMDQVNATSIDITLGPHLLVEGRFPSAFRRPTVEKSYDMPVLNLRERTPMFTTAHNLELQGPFDLLPGQFILAQSAQLFALPNTISAEYKLKSSMARSGLEHLNAGWCDAGWNGSVLTLELKNMTRNHVIRLQAGDRIGQMVFFEHEAVPEDRSYAARGRYNGDTTVSGVKA